MTALPPLRKPAWPPPGWHDWLAVAERLDRRFDGHYALAGFDHRQPLALQAAVPLRLRRAYEVPVACTDWGPRHGPLVVCVGGVANTAMRFAFLAADLAREGFRVVCMDWLGRGRSGWLADHSEYTLASYVEQLRQLIVHLGGEPVALVGSSMGGSVALALAAQAPQLVSRLVLNDVGPHIPRARRLRRAETLARHYVFRSPEELMRRAGAAQKHDGPVADDVRLFIAYHQTCWSPDNGGRIYRHDLRALLAYRDDAASSVDQWAEWSAIGAPVLVLHGAESDALTEPILERMRQGRRFALAHVPDTGHTPVLADRNQTGFIGAWLRGAVGDGVECSLPHAAPRHAWATARDASFER
jgi:pimeloyl-ACP methyl ester carboxylesterase